LREKEGDPNQSIHTNSHRNHNISHLVEGNVKRQEKGQQSLGNHPPKFGALPLRQTDLVAQGKGAKIIVFPEASLTGSLGLRTVGLKFQCGYGVFTAPRKLKRRIRLYKAIWIFILEYIQYGILMHVPILSNFYILSTPG
jgi:hypothetical protein